MEHLVASRTANEKKMDHRYKLLLFISQVAQRLKAW